MAEVEAFAEAYLARQDGGWELFVSGLMGVSAAADSRVFARPDPSKLREFTDDVQDGKFALPISQRLPLRDAAAAQDLVRKGRSREDRAADLGCSAP